MEPISLWIQICLYVVLNMLSHAIEASPLKAEE